MLHRDVGLAGIWVVLNKQGLNIDGILQNLQARYQDPGKRNGDRKGPKQGALLLSLSGLSNIYTAVTYAH